MSRVLTSVRLSEEIVMLFDCNLLVRAYSGDFGLL